MRAAFAPGAVFAATASTCRRRDRLVDAVAGRRCSQQLAVGAQRQHLGAAGRQASAVGNHLCRRRAGRRRSRQTRRFEARVRAAKLCVLVDVAAAVAAAVVVVTVVAALVVAALVVAAWRLTVSVARLAVVRVGENVLGVAAKLRERAAVAVATGPRR